MKRRISPNWTISILLVIFSAVILTVTEPAIGITFDEPVYIASSELYMGWFGVLHRTPLAAFQPETINKYWSMVHEHPPLDRVWSGFVWWIARHFSDNLMAHRLGNILLAAILIGALYLWISREYGRWAGLFSALALISMPRFFFHAHLAALDVPVAAGIFLVTFFFWRTSERKEWWWGILLGIAWGFAEAIKLNATFLLFALAAWALLFRRQWYMLLRFALMGITAVLTFLASWPWMYHETLSRILSYIDFLGNHARVGAWYLGHYYLSPPWHYAFVMTWAVVPLTLILLAFTGIAWVGKGKKDAGLVWLLVISALVTLLVFTTGKSMVYDNDRLFMPVYPFLAGLAGVGFGWLLSLIRRIPRMQPRLATGLSGALALLMVLPQGIISASLFPHLLSYYSESVGGLVGASKLGFETTYWCESYKAALPYINTHARPGDRLWYEPCSIDVMNYYMAHGQLRRDIVLVSGYAGNIKSDDPNATNVIYGDITSADWVIMQKCQSQFFHQGDGNPSILAYITGLGQPVHQVSLNGVPIMQLYETRRTGSSYP